MTTSMTSFEARMLIGRAIVCVLDQGDSLVLVFEDESQLTIHFFEEPVRIVSS